MLKVIVVAYAVPAMGRLPHVLGGGLRLLGAALAGLCWSGICRLGGDRSHGRGTNEPARPTENSCRAGNQRSVLVAGFAGAFGD